MPKIPEFDFVRNFIVHFIFYGLNTRETGVQEKKAIKKLQEEIKLISETKLLPKN